MDSASPFQPWASDDSAKNVKSERDLVDDAKLHRENVNHPKHRQTASYDKESVAVQSSAPGTSGVAGSGAEPARGKESKMDSSKIASMQQIVENTLSQEGRQRVGQLLEAVEALSGAERLLLYLRLPTGVPPHDPLKQPINPLGSRAELQQTVIWIQTHLEVDPDVSLPKQDVYDEYIAHCMSSNMKPLSTADFGKVMKQVYPTVRPRRLGTRGNSRYCYAGLRKKIKLEVPQLPDLGESSKEPTVLSREPERVVCDWAESKLGIKCANISELARHLVAGPVLHTASGPVSASPPPLPHQHGHPEDAASRQLINHLKRKIQGQATPGRPKKNKAQEVSGSSPPGASTSYVHPGLKHEAESEPYYPHPPYVPTYEPRPPYPHYSPRPPAPHDYRADPYAYAPRDLSLPPEHSLPINLSSNASLDLSTERGDWQRRRPPEPPPRLPLPGKKLILETYQSEQSAGSPRAPPDRPAPPPDDFPRAEYLPKKMRAAEIMGGKLTAARAAPSAPAEPAPAPPPADPPVRPEVAFLEDPKNLTSRSKSTAAALAREEQEAASPPRARGRTRSSPRPASPERPATPDSCCGLDGINVRTAVICEERHSEILNRERVISICNIDKHALDDYLNEGNSQEHEEELLQYFHRAPEPGDERGARDKISQLRELLARNLGAGGGPAPPAPALPPEPAAFDAPAGAEPAVNGAPVPPADAAPHLNGTGAMYGNEPRAPPPPPPGSTLAYNGHHHTEPQSPTTRTQQYDFVPISDGRHSPGNFNSKSPLGFGARRRSPTKVNKRVTMGGSLQTSPVSHGTAASPFVSPRNTPVPRSRPIPKLNGKKRRNLLSLADPCSKQFAVPNEQKFAGKGAVCAPLKYYQPMSAPPSPNVLSQYKAHVYPCAAPAPNGVNGLGVHFLASAPFREHTNGDQPLSADPLSSEVSQFFETMVDYRAAPDTFRSQSVPLKRASLSNVAMLSYNNTPVGSVPPTPIPNEFCDFGNLADACDISKAGLNPETLDKIYNAIDSSNEFPGAEAARALLEPADALANGCEPLSDRRLLPEDHLASLMPGGEELLPRPDHFEQTFAPDAAPDSVDDLFKRTDGVEFEFAGLVADKSKYYASRSVPGTPLPFKRAAPNLDIDSRRSRELFAADTYSAATNGISSKSVPSTPQFAEERNVFSYSNRDFLINGNSVSGGAALVEGAGRARALSSPLHNLEEILVDPLTPALLADLDKIDAAPYGEL